MSKRLHPLPKVIAVIAAVWTAATCYAQGQPSEPVRNLGNKLFNDTRLSADGRVSCASCHQSSRAFTDGRSVSSGVRKQLGQRNAQSLLNVGHLSSYFWDGRRDTLEQQVLDPFVNPLEHGLASHDQVLQTIQLDSTYVAAFRLAFPESSGTAVTIPNTAKALAAFVRSLTSPESSIDRFVIQRNAQVLSPSARAGFEVFNKALCAGCHTTTPDPKLGRVLLSDDKFHASGATALSMRGALHDYAQSLLASGKPLSTLSAEDPTNTAALGRFMVTGDLADVGSFKTPSLRNVVKTGPYFHDGSSATLEDAVNRELSVSTGTIVLTAKELADLMSFLHALTDDEPFSQSPRQTKQSRGVNTPTSRTARPTK